MSEKSFFDMSSKQGLVMGLSWGVAIVSIIGLIFFMSGGQSSDSGSKIVGNTNSSGSAPTPTPTPAAAPPPPSGDVSKVSAITDGDYVRGDKNAEITLIEYSDFQCPFCSRHAPTIASLLEQYDGKVNFVYRHFPLNSIHPNAQKSAEAFECAGEQGKPWEMHDLLFANQSALGISNLKTYAGQLGLSQGQFDSCLDDGKYASKVNAQAQEAQASGISGTPGTWVAGQLVKGAYPIATFTQIIDAALAN